MRRHESRASRFEQVVENGTRQSRAFLRIGASAEFIKDDERTMINLFKDVNDVCNMAAERAERLLDGLFVSDISIDRLEAWQFRAALCGDVQSTLRHEREQTDCF